MRIVFHTILVGMIAVSSAVPGCPQTGQNNPFAGGVIRLTPELTISDEAFAGKDFFGEVMSLALDPKGFIYICDSKAKNIKKFDPSGKHLKNIGRPGQGPGEFNYPNELEISRDRLYVRDLFASRINLFDLDGTFLSAISIDRSQGSWRDFRPLPDGRWIVETEFIDRKDPTAPQEMRLALHGPDFAFIKTIYRKPIYRNKYISEPVRTNVPIPFHAAAEWGLTPDGKIVVGLSGDYGIEVIDPDEGRLFARTHRYAPVPVTKKDQDEYFAGMTSGMSTASGSVSVSKGAPDYIVKNTVFPRDKPAFENFAVDGDGRAWSFLWPGSPEAKRTVDVFDSTGMFLGQTRLEGADRLTYVFLFRPGEVWMVFSDDGGEIRIVKYRISG